MKRLVLLLPLLALAAGCASPRIKVASGTDAYALWINYRPIVMAKIPETAGVAKTDGEGTMDIPGNVETVLLVDPSFTKMKKLVRRPAVFRVFGYWWGLSPDGVSLDEDVDEGSLSRMSSFFSNPLLEERLTTDKLVYDTAKEAFFGIRNKHAAP